MSVITVKISSDSRDGAAIQSMAYDMFEEAISKHDPSTQDLLAALAILQDSIYDVTKTICVSDEVREAILRSAE